MHEGRVFFKTESYEIILIVFFLFWKESKVLNSKVSLDHIYIFEISFFAILSRNYTCRRAESLVVKAPSPSNFRIEDATTSHASFGDFFPSPVFYCSWWCSFLVRRTMTWGDGGGEAVFGSFAAVVAVAASTTFDIGGCRRMNVQGSCHDLSIFHARSSLMGIAAAAVYCNPGQMISGLAVVVGFVNCDSLAVI